MRCVDVVVHTSIHPEPFGRVIVEGMLQNRPVVATRGGGVDEIIEDGKTGVLIQSGSAEALSDAVTRLITDKDYYRTIAKSALTETSNKFSIDSTIHRLSNIFDAVSRKGR